MNQNCFSLSPIVWILLRILKNIKYVEMTINHRIYPDNGQQTCLLPGPETGNFYESLGESPASQSSTAQPPGSHSAIEWGAMETQDRNAAGGEEGVGGLTKQCSSGVPNIGPQLAATRQARPASLDSPRQFGDRERRTVC